MATHRVTGLVVFASLVLVASSQTQGSCQVSRSQRMIGYNNVYCRCGQQVQRVNNVDFLTIDQSDCANLTTLDISWRDLEMGFKPKSVKFVRAEMKFREAPNQPWNTTLIRIDFERCIFQSIPGGSFRGLNMLRELRFINSYIGGIGPLAISNLPNLATLEFADSDIVDISEKSISALPNLFELAFVRSNIGTLKENAIYNIRLPDLPSVQDCPEIDIRTNLSLSRGERFMGNVMARSLESVDNLPLPEFGARCLFYKNNISTIESSAIASDMFAFVVLGGNDIEMFSSRALTVQLSNQCEISALMVVSNTFVNLKSDAFMRVTAQKGASHATYFVMTNNTFEYVDANGFHLDPSLQSYSVADNKFLCLCNNFEWALTKAATPEQQELDKNLLLLGTCLTTNVSVTAFTSTCAHVVNTGSSSPRTTTIHTHNFPDHTEISVVTLPDTEGSGHNQMGVTSGATRSSNAVQGLFALMAALFLVEIHQ